jgi:hypothetical protein
MLVVFGALGPAVGGAVFYIYAWATGDMRDQLGALLAVIVLALYPVGFVPALVTGAGAALVMRRLHPPWLLVPVSGLSAPWSASARSSSLLRFPFGGSLGR